MTCNSAAREENHEKHQCWLWARIQMWKYKLNNVRLFLAASLVAAASVSAKDLTLKYSQPGSRWTEALPVGDGRLGAMIFGSVTNEHLQLNEATLWSGGPRDWNNPGAKEVL